ncbi:MAG: Nif3-like dinuclear metal center hexameric protein [Desulfobulbus sp.]
MPTVQTILDILAESIPRYLAEDWDNVGLLAGTPHREVHRILIGLDPVLSLLKQARAGQYDLIITHHPVLFHPLKAVRTDQPIGSFIAGAIRADIGVIACHTNLDAVPGGVSDHLARALGLEECAPITPAPRGEDPACGLGRIGVYSEPISAEHFLDRVRTACQPPWILEAGPRPQQIQKAAVCGGSCSSFAELVLELGADVFLTAEIKHSVACWAEDAGLWLLDAGHFATEYPAMVPFRDLLRARMAAQGLSLTIDTAPQTPPLRLVTAGW